MTDEEKSRFSAVHETRQETTGTADYRDNQLYLMRQDVFERREQGCN